MKTIDRIYQFVKEENLSLREFEKAAKIGNGYLAKIKAGEGDVGHRIIIKICAAFKEINYDWLSGITEGPMKKDYSKNSTNKTEVELLKLLLDEKDERISDLKTQVNTLQSVIDDLKSQLAEKNTPAMKSSIASNS